MILVQDIKAALNAAVFGGEFRKIVGVFDCVMFVQTIHKHAAILGQQACVPLWRDFLVQ